MAYHNFDYVSTDAQDVKTVVSRTEATQVLVLDSKNRNVSAQPGGPPISQPWNYFRLQRPQALMQSYATRVGVSEIRFPWYIPNITSKNNYFFIESSKGLGTESVEILLAPGYYTPDQLVTAINLQITAFAFNEPPVLSYDNNTSSYTFTGGDDGNQSWLLIWNNPFLNPNLPAEVDEDNYNKQSSLARTLGFTFYQASGLGLAETGGPYTFTGNPTESLYTEYIDIVSEKLNYYSDQKDGSSDPLTSQALVCRLYLADEISIGQNEGNFFQPFLIHRQFKTPKTLMWNKDAVVDWLDIAVYDAYGQLVPLPTINYGTTTAQGSYPNFQITLLATEN